MRLAVEVEERIRVVQTAILRFAEAVAQGLPDPCPELEEVERHLY